MAYLIFNNVGDNFQGCCLSKIAENENDLNNLNIIKSDLKIIEISSEDFNLIKLKKKFPLSYNGNIVNYADPNNEIPKQMTSVNMQKSIDAQIETIKQFIKQNPNHPDKNKWNSYLSQLANFNVNSLNYPLTKSLEEHFNDIGQPSLNILQLP